MKILSFGAGMQSTALALMACENAVQISAPFPLVPVYDAVIFCDLGLEPPWVKTQLDFTWQACEDAGIPFYILNAPLYADFLNNFGERRTISIPWWTLRGDGHQSRMPRNCTSGLQGIRHCKICALGIAGLSKRPASSVRGCQSS